LNDKRNLAKVENTFPVHNEMEKHSKPFGEGIYDGNNFSINFFKIFSAKYRQNK